MMVLVGFNRAQLSEELRLVEMRILAQSLQLPGSVIDQMRKRRQDCSSPPSISGRSQRQGRTVERPNGKPLTPALRPEAPASGNPALNQDLRLPLMNEYSNSESTALIPAYRPFPRSETYPANTTLSQVESLAAYPTTFRRDIFHVAEPKLRSTVGRPRTLTDQQIRMILEEYAKYIAWRARRRCVMSQRDLARAMGVSPATVSYAVRLRGKYKQPSPDRRQANTHYRRRALRRLVRNHLL
jgi:hypothetical protein